jgi:hypothetical protein
VSPAARWSTMVELVLCPVRTLRPDLATACCAKLGTAIPDRIASASVRRPMGRGIWLLPVEFV